MVENPLGNLFEIQLDFLLEIMFCSKFSGLNRQIHGVDGRTLRRRLMSPPWNINVEKGHARLVMTICDAS